MAVFAHRQALILRRRTISSKVTDEEYGAFEALALASNQTVSAWVRDSLMMVASQGSAEQTVLAEVLALRKILLNLHFAIVTGESITRDRMARLIEEADTDKGQKAAVRLQAR